FDIPKHAQILEDCCRHCEGVICGSEFIAAWCRQFNNNVHVIWTCTPVPREEPALPPSERKPIVAWGHSAPLGFPDECELLRSIMAEVSTRRECELWLYGRVSPDQLGAFLEPFRASGIACRFWPFMSYERYLKTMHQVAVGLQPLGDQVFAKGRSFGKVLAYLQNQVPVVCANAM